MSLIHAYAILHPAALDANERAVVLSWASTPFLSGWWLTAAIPAAMAVVYLAAARAEEREFNASALASDYERYSARAGMLWPRFR